MYYTLSQTFKKLVFNYISKNFNWVADLPRPRILSNSGSPEQLGLSSKSQLTHNMATMHSKPCSLVWKCFVFKRRLTAL